MLRGARVVKLRRLRMPDTPLDRWVQRTTLVFRVIFSWMLNRDHEVLGLSALVGIGISAIGVVFVIVMLAIAYPYVRRTLREEEL